MHVATGQTGFPSVCLIIAKLPFLQQSTRMSGRGRVLHLESLNDWS